MANTSYATIAELKERVGIAASDTGSDGLLQQVLNSAAFLVDLYTRGVRPGYEAFSASAGETRYFSDEVVGYVHIDDAVAVTSVSRGDTMLDPESWKVFPYQDGAAPNLPITALVLSADAASPGSWAWYGYPLRDQGAGQIAVVGQWGYCAAADRPPLIKEAALTQAALMFAAIGRNSTNRTPWEQLHPAAAVLLNGLRRSVLVM